MHLACDKAERLAASAELARRPGPADEQHQAIHAVAELLRGHQGADVCVIVLRDPYTEKSSLYRADDSADTALLAKGIESDAAALLLAESNEPLIFNRRHARSSKCSRSDGLAQLANLLQAGSFISLPLRAKQRVLGRVYLASRRARYSGRDAGCLAPLVRQAASIIEDMRVVRRLATEVASEERKRISRDLHDGTIQPYVGLKLGLEALRRKVQGDNALVREVEELINMASDGIGELRQYVGSLKRTEARKKHADWLLPAVRRQAQKFTEFYGIRTRVLAANDIPVTASLHDHIIHIVREGLSNIRRHTSATKATICLREAPGSLLVELINNNPGRDGAKCDFFPRSIGERAQELGGRLKVEYLDGRRTVVAVELPISEGIS